MQGQPAPSRRLAAPGHVRLLAIAGSLLVLLAIGGQQPAAAQQPQGPAAQRPQANRAPVTRAETRPAWAELNVDQQQALRPLSVQWPTLSEAQKRKWIALSSNYRALPPPEQAKLHSRMTEWVSLSPQQRTQARLNFAEAKTLSPDDRKAKWEAYQALPADEKRKLAGVQGKTPPTAAAVRPVPAQKLANVPRGKADSKPPRIAVGPLAEAHPRNQPAPHGAPATQAN
jgi:hypothetical protein